MSIFRTCRLVFIVPWLPQYKMYILNRYIFPYRGMSCPKSLQRVVNVWSRSATEAWQIQWCPLTMECLAQQALIGEEKFVRRTGI